MYDDSTYLSFQDLEVKARGSGGQCHHPQTYSKIKTRLSHIKLCQERNKGTKERGGNKIKRPRISKQLRAVKVLFSVGYLWLCKGHTQEVSADLRQMSMWLQALSFVQSQSHPSSTSFLKDVINKLGVNKPFL